MDKTSKNKEIKSNIFKNLEEQNNNEKKNKNIEGKSENEIIKKKTFTNNNQIFLEMDNLNTKYNKLNSNKINRINLNNEIKDNDENILKTAPNSISNSQISNISEDNNNIFLKSETILKSVDNDTFCIGFFIVSFNFNNPKIIENSNELTADCSHTSCFSSPAISPEIYPRYPENDTDDFEISEIGASICFPNELNCVSRKMRYI